MCRSRSTNPLWHLLAAIAYSIWYLVICQAFQVQKFLLSQLPPRCAIRKTSGRTTSHLILAATSLAPAISIENLSCTHNGGETWQLQDVSYVLPRGSKMALVGYTVRIPHTVCINKKKKKLLCIPVCTE